MRAHGIGVKTSHHPFLLLNPGTSGAGLSRCPHSFVVPTSSKPIERRNSSYIDLQSLRMRHCHGQEHTENPSTTVCGVCGKVHSLYPDMCPSLDGWQRRVPL